MRLTRRLARPIAGMWLLACGVSFESADSTGGQAASGGSGAGVTGGAGGIAGSGAAGGYVAGAGGTAGAGAMSTGGGCVNTMSDPVNCGACGHLCQGSNTVTTECVGGLCVHRCAADWLDCESPVAPSPDDGCESDKDADTTCGACGNDCVALGGTCLEQSNGNHVCECGSATDCGNTVAVTCDGGRCHCPAANHCAYGEQCLLGFCKCNVTGDCNESDPGDGHHLEVCCPDGCVNLRSDPNNCGACGFVCPGGKSCSSGSCV